MDVVMKLLLLCLCVCSYAEAQECIDTIKGCNYFRDNDLCEKMRYRLADKCALTCGFCLKIYTPAPPSPTTPTSPPQTCKDNYPGCRFLKTRYCKEVYRERLTIYCAKTCGWCEGSR